MKKIVTILLMVMTVSVFAQTQNISGKITDSSGDPLPGVTVVIKGTTIGVVSDVDGNYSITNVSKEHVLNFSFVGMLSQEIVVGDQTSISVTLIDDAIGIDEVVAIGYGTQKKATVTGSISTIAGEELAKNPSINVVTALAGHLPGLVVTQKSGSPGGEGTKITIRGKQTWDDGTGQGASNNVLVIVDGTPGSLDGINPADIQSMSVLKDASAAIYGVRAANGVILITTKRGGISAPKLTYSANYGIAQPTRLQNLLESWEYAQAENEYLVNNGQRERWTEEDIELFQNGEDPLFHPNIDWYDITFRDWTPQQQHNLSLTGGTEKIKYYLSGRITDQDRTYKEGDGKGLNKFQLRSNIDAQINKLLSVGVDLTLSKDKEVKGYQGNGRPFFQIKQMKPHVVPFWPNGLPGPTPFGVNPVTMHNSEIYGYDNEDNIGMSTKLSFNLDLSPILSGLSVSGYGKFGESANNYKKFFKQSYYYGYDAEKDEYVEFKTGQVTQSPALEETSIRNQSSLYHAKLGYIKNINNHSIDAFVAYEQSQSTRREFAASQQDFLTDQLPVLDAGGQTLITATGNMAEHARKNYFGRVNYGYADKYLMSASLRRDGSENFPSEKRYGIFPGVSTGWVLSEESFIKGNYSFVNMLKLKASWGQMGSDRINPFQHFASYEYGRGYYFGTTAALVPGFKESTTPNYDVTWETSTTTNLGFESVLWTGLLSLNFDLFKTERTDILRPLTASTPDYSGLNLPDVNMGEVHSKGFEIEAAHSNIVNSDFKYWLNGNMSYAINEVIFFDEAQDIPEYQKLTGFPLDSWLVYQADGLYQTQEEIDATPHLAKTAPGDLKYIDMNDDGQIDGSDKVREELSPTPKVMYGITLGAQYKNWELTVFLQGAAKSKVAVIPQGLNMDKEFFDGRWLEEGDNKYPRSFNSETWSVGVNGKDNMSTFWLKKGGYLRFKTVELSYTLPNNLTDRINIGDVRLYVNASNLFVIYDHVKIVDPEILTNTRSNNNDLATYPPSRLINFGVNITF